VVEYCYILIRTGPIKLLKRITFFPKFMAVLQLYYIYQMSISSNIGSIDLSKAALLPYFMSVITIIILATIVGNSLKSPMARLVSALGLLTIFDVMIAYHFSARQQIEWSALADNASGAFSLDALYTIFHRLDISALAYLPFIIGIMLWVDYKKKYMRYPKYVLTKMNIFILSIIYIVVLMSQLPSNDPFISLFRSIAYYYNSPLEQHLILEKKPQHALIPNAIKTVERPHVFLILVESLNANYLDYKDANNQPVTPFLKELSNQSLTVETFYGNSIQTAKGHAAILLSAMPSIRSKLFTKFQDIELNSIFEYVKAEGYRTLVFLSHDNIHYDNAYTFLKNKQLDDMVSVHTLLKEKDKQFKTRWGIQDNILMQYFFEYFASYSKKYQQPIFSVIVTGQSHVPFILPPHMRNVFPNADSKKEHYANCLNNVDKGIEVFYKELKKRKLNSESVVIVTADHSYPMGGHNIHNQEAGLYEESYLIPFFLTAPGVENKQLKGAYSQIDIAPTILDLLNIQVEDSTFIGESIFSSTKIRSVPQIQPYKKQIGIVRFPLKYRYAIKLDTEYAYNLIDDPLEKRNIVSTLTEEELSIFRLEVKKLFEIQKYYE
jgi:arylsulfatase A-like enzyme